MQIQFDGAVQQDTKPGALEKYDKRPRPPGWEVTRRHDVRTDFPGQIRADWFPKG